jgi:hypothetical protein
MLLFVYLFEDEHPAQRKQPRKFLASNNLQIRGNLESYFHKNRGEALRGSEKIQELTLLN